MSKILLDRKLKKSEKKTKIYDSKASKDRKLKYDVHAKLVNFMFAISND